ncbi:MAG: type ISP restriction/modification enzyme, partial [Oxalobacter sp.]
SPPPQIPEQNNLTNDASQEQNIEAFEELLNQLETVSSNHANFTGSFQRNKGTRFETLCQSYFQKEPTYKGLFSKIESFRQWAENHPELSANAKDIGIDLVATLADNTGYAAIQCKFYGKHQSVSKPEIDSFISASSKKHFTQRYIVATNEKWSDNVISELHNTFPPVSILTRETLARSAIDWTAYLKNEDDVKLIAPRKPRGYQVSAIRDVVKGLEEADRGKLIMACGTGKTFTSMKFAEEIEGKGGFVMFLVPSLSLLSQTLSDWKQNCQYPINAYAVCSDSRTGMADLSDIDNLLSVTELNYPATTDPKILAEKVNKDLLDKDSMTVIFSTYQSIEVVHQAQKDFGLPEIGLAICDEAHRTAGGYLVDFNAPVDSEESQFTRIHDNNYIRSKKRLYMTATPKIYGKTAKQQEKDGEAVIYSMDDETVFGKTLHEITFREAVALGSLVDYKVIVLTISQDVAGDLLSYDATQNGGISISNYAKIIGTWRALTKQDLKGNAALGDDFQQMKRAVGFAQVINPKEKGDSVASKQFAEHFQQVIEDYKNKVRERLIEENGNIDEAAFHAEFGMNCDTRHIDGTMNANEKGALLDWLRATPEDDQCKILFNVRCLSEGVDVPALDAVVFLSPRKSQVDVVQTVGRVMRTSPKTNKKRGYVIIPIVTPPQVEADLVLNNNREFDTVWQVLKALRSIDPEFGAIVDGQLKKIDTDKIEVISLTEEIKKKSRKSSGSGIKGKKPQKTQKKATPGFVQGELTFSHDHILEEELKARIVKKVGNVREWEEWAADVGTLCQEQIKHLKQIVSDPQNGKQIAAFETFHTELKATINNALSADDALEMLGQHIVTKPVLDALFSEYPFTEQNPISKALTSVLDVLDSKEMASSSKQLKDFYDSVKFRAKNITNLAERQIVVRELFEKFFKIAFPKTQDKLGIVFTPEPIVDFINQSVSDLLKQEFGVSIADKGIHILDPFTGTGTFLTRMMQRIIPKEKLASKYESELHANEIVPLAYYVSAMNVEAAYHDLMPDSDYKPNNIMVWTDTFADNQKSDFFKSTLAENNARLARLNEQDIRVIIGNPPYSVGQESQNDDNQNEHYEQLDKRLAETYVAKSNATLKNSLYDSYIRAYRWASDRIGDKGIIGFVTNAGWIDSNSANGMRKCMAEEFSSIYVYHLKGNQRTVGEQSRKEGGKVFGSGSRAPVAIVLLVKNPDATEQGRIYFNMVDDYLTAEEKLAQVKDNGSIINMDWQTIIPDSHGDWLNQRDDSYSNFMRMDGKKTVEQAIFSQGYSSGLKSNRDAWVYNSSTKRLKSNMGRSISFYNQQVKEAQSFSAFEPDLNPKSMKWDVTQKKGIENQKLTSPFDTKNCYISSYRPFVKQHLYFDRFWNNSIYQMPQLFPKADSENLVIAVNQGTKGDEQIAIMTNALADLHFNGDAQCFPRYIYTANTEQQKDDLFAGEQAMGRKDGISPEALAHFRQAYPSHGNDITVDDLFYYIYGILHSEDYRKKYANNLMKELPRIPRVATYEQFKAFSDAGRKLADLHVNYESVPEYQGATVDIKDPNDMNKFRVSKMKYGKIPGKTGNAGKDKTRIFYNSNITIDNIPLEAQEYIVNKRSALDWILERADYRVDKASGIVNDFNDYAEELGDPRYPLSLVLRIITVSLETMKIVKALPPLEIHPWDK